MSQFKDSKWKEFNDNKSPPRLPKSLSYETIYQGSQETKEYIKNCEKETQSRRNSLSSGDKIDETTALQERLQEAQKNRDELKKLLTKVTKEYKKANKEVVSLEYKIEQMELKDETTNSKVIEKNPGAEAYGEKIPEVEKYPGNEYDNKQSRSSLKEKLRKFGILSKSEDYHGAKFAQSSPGAEFVPDETSTKSSWEQLKEKIAHKKAINEVNKQIQEAEWSFKGGDSAVNWRKSALISQRESMEKSYREGKPEKVKKAYELAIEGLQSRRFEYWRSAVISFKRDYPEFHHPSRPDTSLSKLGEEKMTIWLSESPQGRSANREIEKYAQKIEDIQESFTAWKQARKDNRADKYLIPPEVELCLRGAGHSFRYDIPRRLESLVLNESTPIEEKPFSDSVVEESYDHAVQSEKSHHDTN